MAITMRLEREEEQRLRSRAAPHNSELEEGLRALTEAMRAAFPGLDSVVRMESEDGRLMAEALDDLDLLHRDPYLFLLKPRLERLLQIADERPLLRRTVAGDRDAQQCV
jgi:hypothetical protein